MDGIAGVGLVLVLLVIAIWGTGRVIGLRSAATPQPTARSISDILAASAGVAGTLTPTPTAAGTLTLIPTAGITAIGTVPTNGTWPGTDRACGHRAGFCACDCGWEIRFNGRVSNGTAYLFNGNEQIEVLTGDGLAISILFNQSNLGAMGRFGEVVDRIYTAKAILNPTPTFTLTPSITPTPTLTPRFSPTPSPDGTPTVPATP